MEKVAINQIKENPSNPRKIDKLAYQKLLNSIKEFPEMLELRPLVVDKNMVVIGGNMRLKALRELKYEVVPVIRADKLTDEQIKRFVIVDNLPFGEWDYELLQGQYGVEELDQWGFDTAKMGVYKDKNEKDDDVPEVPEEPVSKLGDFYEIGGHKIMCGDSTKKEDVDRLMGGVQADMVFTDPPYNVDYEGRGKNTSNKIKNDNMGDSEFDTFLGAVFERYKENSKRGAGWYVFHSTSTQDQFQNAIEKAGWNVKNQIIWNKPVASMGWGDYRWKHEPMFYCGNEKTVFYGDRANTTVLDIPEDDEEAIKWLRKQKELESKGLTTIWTMKREPVNGYVHPTQKPVELICYALTNSSKRDDIIMDLFLGSGATMVACEKKGRKCYGMELDPKYVDVCVSRMCEFTGNYEIIKNGEKIQWK